MIRAVRYTRRSGHRGGSTVTGGSGHEQPSGRPAGVSVNSSASDMPKLPATVGVVAFLGPTVRRNLALSYQTTLRRATLGRAPGGLDRMRPDTPAIREFGLLQPDVAARFTVRPRSGLAGNIHR